MVTCDIEAATFGVSELATMDVLCVGSEGVGWFGSHHCVSVWGVGFEIVVTMSLARVEFLLGSSINCSRRKGPQHVGLMPQAAVMVVFAHH